MSSSSDASLIASLNNVTTQLNRYFVILIVLFGSVGNILNILVLSQRTLRSNPCAWLFLVSSIANFIGILAGLSTRFLSTWGADLTQTNQFLCKFRIFLFYDSITVAFWLIMLATVDRWFSSSTDVNRRQRSTLKNAQRGMIIIVTLSTIIETQQLYCFEANLTYTPIKCFPKTVACSLVSNLTFAIVTILFPLLLMMVFGLMIISNVRHVQSRLQPVSMTAGGRVAHDTSTVTTGTQNQRKKTDRQLLIMLFVQVLLMLLFTLPVAISEIYSTITRNTPKSALKNVTENTIFNVFFLLLNIACGMPFYIYTLSGGSVFRRALFSLMETLGRKIMCRRG